MRAVATLVAWAPRVADLIPGAVFEVMAGEAHQPFQEVPETF